jgi:hypothetical protein
MSSRRVRRELRQQLEAEWRRAYQTAGARKLTIWVSETRLGAVVSFRSLFTPGWWTEVRYAKRRGPFGRIEPLLSRVDAMDQLRAELATYLKAGLPAARWTMPRAPLQLIVAGLGAVTVLLGAIAQPFVLLTYAGGVDTGLAGRFVGLSVVAASTAFVAAWLIGAKRTEFSSGWDGSFAGVPGILERSIPFFGVYSLLAFLLLLLVSFALRSKGVLEVSGHFYIRHPFPEQPTEITRDEYQRQVGYLFWWVSTLALIWGTVLLSVALRAFVVPWRTQREPKPNAD